MQSTISNSKMPTPLSLSQLSISTPAQAMSSATHKAMTTSAKLLALHDIVASTRESRVICDKVLTRLQVLNRQLEHMISMSTGSTHSSNGGTSMNTNSSSINSKNQVSQQDKAVVKLGELVALFEQFVQCDTQRNIVLRLTDARRFRQIQDLHEELDATFRMLRLEHVDPERQWRSDWAQDREDVECQFQQALGKREVLYRELRTPSAQAEALAVLRFAMEQHNGSRGQATQLTASPEMIRSAFRKLLSMATVEMPVVPSWLISPAMLSFEDVPFAGGEQAQVFRASWGLFKTTVAIKRATDGYKQVLLDEAELWATFDHPSVLRMHGGFPVGDHPFLVLEYPANGPLDEYLLTSSEQHHMTYRLLWQAANGLKFIHDQKAHCAELKLSSIFVGSDGVAKVGQFVSFFRAGEQYHAAAGSIRWKAPEVLRGASDIDAFAVDVYAFAMCILEAVTGELPWGWTSDAEVRARVLEGQLPDRPDRVSDPAWSLLTWICDMDPAKRPKMKAVVKQMQALAEEEESEQARAASLTSSLGSSVFEDLDGDEYRPESRRKTIARATMLHADNEDSHSFRRNNTMLNASAGSSGSDDASTTIVVTLHHKWLGVKINSIGNRIVVSKFLRSSSGAVGEIEASAQVRLGDVIVAVNNRSVVGMDRNQVGQTIQNTPRPLQLMLKREVNLLEDSFQFHGLRIEERWRDRGSIVPMPEGAELMLGSVFDTFTFSICFSLSDSDDTVYGGILLGAQDLSCEDQAWPYTHHQLVMVDPQGNLSSFFLQDETPVLIARELQPSRWYHLVVAYDSQAVSVYLDGQLKHQAKGVLYRQWPKLNHLNIGSGCISRAPDSAKPSPDFCGWFGFNGLIQDACVWHSALRELEVQQLFRGASDFVDTPVYSLRRDVAKELPGSHPPRRVVATRPLHVVAQTYN